MINLFRITFTPIAVVVCKEELSFKMGHFANFTAIGAGLFIFQERKNVQFVFSNVIGVNNVCGGAGGGCISNLKREAFFHSNGELVFKG